MMWCIAAEGETIERIVHRTSALMLPLLAAETSVGNSGKQPVIFRKLMVGYPEITPVLPFRSYYWSGGNPLGTRSVAGAIQVSLTRHHLDLRGTL
jgi:hypothetical protein